MPTRRIDAAALLYLLACALLRLGGLPSPDRLLPGAHAAGFALLTGWALRERRRTTWTDRRREFGWIALCYAGAAAACLAEAVGAR